MSRVNTTYSGAERRAMPQSCVSAPVVYTRETFRAILARQPEWKVRAALEEGNIPSSNVEHALEWLEEQEQQAHQQHEHQGYWS